ncbi:MAG: EamA family transporter [Elusimicrobiota bacterium]
MWFVLSLLTAVFYAAQGAWSKKTTKKVDRFTTTWSMFSFALPVLIIPLLITGIPQISTNFFWAAPGSLILNMVAYTLFVTALELSPLSLTYPFLSFTPIFLIGTGYLFLGELPDLKGLTGIILITGGAYLINFKEISRGILAPIKEIKNEKGSLIMLIVAFIWSFAGAMDKVAVEASSPFFFIVVFNTGFLIFYLPFLKYKNPDFEKEVVKHKGKLFILGVFGAFMVISQMVALKLTLVSYVIAIKRSGMLFTLLIGKVFFDEKITTFNVVGTVLMCLGLILIGI